MDTTLVKVEVTSQMILDAVACDPLHCMVALALREANLPFSKVEDELVLADGTRLSMPPALNAAVRKFDEGQTILPFFFYVGLNPLGQIAGFSTEKKHCSFESLYQDNWPGKHYGYAPGEGASLSSVFRISPDMQAKLNCGWRIYDRRHVEFPFDSLPGEYYEKTHFSEVPDDASTALVTSPPYMERIQGYTGDLTVNVTWDHWIACDKDELNFLELALQDAGLGSLPFTGGEFCWGPEEEEIPWPERLVMYCSQGWQGRFEPFDFVLMFEDGVLKTVMCDEPNVYVWDMTSHVLSVV